MKSRVAIEAIAAGGEGIGHLEDGLVVFVPRSAPGDVLVVEVTKRRARYARGRISELTEPSPHRVDPSCVHYARDDCGGCQLQHLAAEAQRDAKKKIVGDALRRIGKFHVSDPQLVASPRQWRYRSKITVTVRGDRFGLRRLGRPDAVFDLSDCLLTQEPVMLLWNCVSRNRQLLPVDVESLVLRMDRIGGRHVLASSGEIWDAEPLASACDEEENTSIWWKPSNGAPRAVAGASAGFPAVAFEQVNSTLADEIRATAVDYLGKVDGKVAWDLYGGVGDTAEILAERGARVWTVDSDRAAVEWGRNRGATIGGTGTSITRISERVEECLARLPAPDVVVVNPPRTGLEQRLTSWLQSWGKGANGARLAYISCDPATLSRDLTRMPAFELDRIVAYDLFPQTGHVETLTLLEAA